MRAFAVVAVVINHFDPSLLPSGYLGVDIFFVISGYVITESLASQHRHGLAEFLQRFYIRRFKRLFPALGFYILVATLCVALLDPSTRTTLKTGFFALFGLSNIYLLSISTDYFSESAELNAFTHTWSLGVEQQFYLVFPLFFWTMLKSGRRFAPVLTAIIVISLSAFLLLSAMAPSVAYFSPVTRFWELAFGSLAYFVAKPKTFAMHYGALANLLLPALAGLLFLPVEMAPLATTSVVMLSAVAVIVTQAPSVSRGGLSWGAVAAVGRVSYSLYLWHWFVLWLSRLTVGIEWWTVPFQVGAIAALSLASYRYIELPFRYEKWSSSKARSFAYASLAVIAIGAINLAVEHPLRGKFHIANWIATGPSEHLQKTWWIDKTTGEALEPCHVPRYFAGVLEKCLAPIRPDARTVFLVGDSHARNYVPAFRAVFGRDNVRYLTVGHGCTFLPDEMAQELSKYGCETYVSDVRRFIEKEAKPNDIVVVGQRLFEADRRRSQPDYFAHLIAFAHALAPKRIDVIVLDGVHPPAFPPERCLDVPWRKGLPHGCSVPAETVKTAFSSFDLLARDAMRAAPNLFYAPLRLGLCDGNACGQTLKDGTYVWHDRGHITERAAETLAPMLKQALADSGFPLNP